MKKKNAIVSVFDKQGIDFMCHTLVRFGWNIISTGGTAKHLAQFGVPVQEVSDFTGFPEMMDGRVKTLHPKIHGGLLHLRHNEAHVQDALRHGIEPIDMVVVNLYPFAETVQKGSVNLADAVEQIDIGGVSLLRSAAKNFHSVTVLSNPDDYHLVIDELVQKGEVSFSTKLALAKLVFYQTEEYEKQIADYLRRVEMRVAHMPMIDDLARAAKGLKELKITDSGSC